MPVLIVFLWVISIPNPLRDRWGGGTVKSFRIWLQDIPGKNIEPLHEHDITEGLAATPMDVFLEGVIYTFYIRTQAYISINKHITNLETHS